MSITELVSKLFTKEEIKSVNPLRSEMVCKVTRGTIDTMSTDELRAYLVANPSDTYAENEWCRRANPIKRHEI